MEAFLNMMWAAGGPGESWDQWGAGGGGSEGDAGGAGCCKDGGGKGGGGKDGGGYGKKGGKKGKGGGGKDGGKGGKFGGGKGKVETKIANGEMLYHGQVKAFNVEKKHGYIYCEDIYYQCSQDVYAFADVLERGCAGPGDLVCFFVHWSPKGQPQASSPLLRIAANEGYWALKGQFKAAKDPSSGFGFIECAETKEFFGRDVYVNKDLAATATPGEVVRFNAYLNRDGMPNASNMESLDDPFWEPEATDISVSWSAPGVGKGGKKGKGGGKGKKGDAGWGASWPALPSGNVTDKGDGKGKKGSGKGKKGSAAQPQPTGESHTGTIKSFNWDNNYGFIACEEVTQRFGFDVFVHGKELQGQGVGEQVMFELGINSKGQPQAMNVVSMSGGEAGSPEQPGPAAKRQKVESPDEAAAAALSAMNAIAQGMGQPTMDASGAWAWGAGSAGAPGVVV